MMESLYQQWRDEVGRKLYRERNKSYNSWFSLKNKNTIYANDLKNISELYDALIDAFLVYEPTKESEE
jgi:hypothetical protein